MAFHLKHIGFISRSHGFKGEVILASDSNFGSGLKKNSFLFLMIDQKPVPFLIEKISDNGDNIIIKIEDIGNESDARKLSGLRAYIDASAIDVDVSSTDFLDIKGYTAYDKSYGELGIIEWIEEFPDQLIAKCSVFGKEVLIPLHENIILSIDDQKKTIMFILPEGFLDIYLNSK